MRISINTTGLNGYKGLAVNQKGLAVNQRLWSGLADGLRIYSSEVEDETHFVTTAIISYKFWINFVIICLLVLYNIATFRVSNESAETY